MAETAVTVQSLTAPFAAVTAGSADFVFAASDSVNGNSFVCTGRELLLMENDSGGALTVTITSVDDEKGRSEDITAYSLADGDRAVFGIGLTNEKGWKTSSGLCIFTASAVGLKYAVLRLP